MFNLANNQVIVLSSLSYSYNLYSGDGGGGRSAPGGTFRGAAKLRLYLKIWKEKKYFGGEKF